MLKNDEEDDGDDDDGDDDKRVYYLDFIVTWKKREIHFDCVP